MVHFNRNPFIEIVLFAVTRIVCSGRSRPLRATVKAQAADKKYDYDLVIIGCGVGGHGAALHAVEQVIPIPKYLDMQSNQC